MEYDSRSRVFSNSLIVNVTEPVYNGSPSKHMLCSLVTLSIDVGKTAQMLIVNDDEESNMGLHMNLDLSGNDGEKIAIPFPLLYNGRFHFVDEVNGEGSHSILRCPEGISNDCRSAHGSNVPSPAGWPPHHLRVLLCPKH